MSQSTLSNDLEANDIDFFKKKFADFETLDRQLKTWQTLNYVQLKQRTSKPAKLNEEFSNAEQVKSQKYESIRYECIHYGMPRPHKYQTTGSRPNTVSNAVDCKCFYHYKWNVDHFELFNSHKKHANHPETQQHWESHPNQRKLSVEEREKLAAMFKLEAPFRNITRAMKELTGIILILSNF